MSNKEFIIKVNGTDHTLTDETVTYIQVVQLAYPDFVSGGNKTASVTFEHAKEPKQGTLSEGGTVIVKPRNTEFDVIRANRS
jgi:hypothetical protein